MSQSFLKPKSIRNYSQQKRKSLAVLFNMESNNEDLSNSVVYSDVSFIRTPTNAKSQSSHFNHKQISKASKFQPKYSMKFEEKYHQYHLKEDRTLTPIKSRLDGGRELVYPGLKK